MDIAFMLIGLFAINVTICITSYKEKQELHKTIDALTDKLMARDFTEYKEMTQGPVVYEPVDNSEEDEYWREQEELREAN